MAIQVHRLATALGAEVRGVDLSRPLAEDAAETVRRALWNHAVIVIRDQRLTPEQQIAFSRIFGPLERHVLADNLLAGHPDILVLSNKKAGEKRLGRAYAGEYWHSDSSYLARPALGSVLYGIEVPVGFGDTQWVNLAAAYAALSPAMQRLCDGLTGLHEFQNAYRSYLGVLREFSAGAYEGEYTRVVPVAHPLVRRHLPTGRKSLYYNPGFTVGFEELNAAEGDALLRFLADHCTRPEFTFRHHWQQRDVVVWDNRRTMHRLVVDFDDDQPRYMHRTTVVGEVPEGANATA